MMSENTEKTLDIKYKTVNFAKDNPEVAQLKVTLTTYIWRKREPKVTYCCYKFQNQS